MARNLRDLSNEELAVATVATEKRVGIDGAEAKLFRAEVARRAAADKGITDYVDRARRFAALIAEGMTMEFFHRPSFGRADRQLALALGAGRSWPRVAGGAFNAFPQRSENEPR
jgi:hypothetical protein